MSKGVDSLIRVEVVYALAERQILVELEVEEGATVLQAIERSGIAAMKPGIDPGVGVGIYGKPAGPGTRLRDGDRVEIYRPLIADPKQARRARVGRRK